MKQKLAIKKLAKTLAYMLGHRPDEFGLVPNPDGYVSLKDLIKALHAEEGFKHIRRRHIEEIMMMLPDSSVEIKGHLIRATDRENLLPQVLARDLPKLLYTCVRPKAYPVIQSKGRLDLSHRRIILSEQRGMAEKMGHRLDAAPVLLTVHVQKALDLGVSFMQAGEALFLAESIPASCLSGPPVARQPDPPKAPIAPLPKKDTMPGSYIVDWSRSKTVKPASLVKKKDKDVYWKKERKHRNRQREKRRGQKI